MHQVCILCRFIALQYEQSSVALCLPEFAADVYDDALESAFFTDSLPCSVTELCGSFSSGGALDRWSEIVFYDFRSGLLNFECASFRDVSSPCTICQSSCPDYVHADGIIRLVDWICLHFELSIRVSPFLLFPHFVHFLLFLNEESSSAFAVMRRISCDDGH